MARKDAGMWMRAAEVAVFLGVSVDTVYRHADDGKIPAFRLGRLWKFNRTEMEQFVQKQSRRGVTLHAK